MKATIITLGTIFFLFLMPIVRANLTTYYFFLDTSVYKKGVIIDKPSFPPKTPNLNQYVSCISSTTHNPLVVEGINAGAYTCRATSKLDLKSNQTYETPIIIKAHYLDQQIIIQNSYFTYDPWHPQNCNSHAYLIYLDTYGKLSAREV